MRITVYYGTLVLRLINFYKSVDMKPRMVYNINTYGAAMVSTGVLRYDKRSGPDNPVKMSNLNNKRQH